MTMFRLTTALAFLTLALSSEIARADFPRLALKPISLNQVHSPTTIVNANDGTGRLFVCDQPGVIYVIEGGSMLGTPFLNIASTGNVAPDDGPGPVVTVTTGYTERGLLGMAFHPGHANPASPGYRKFYLNYSKPYVAGVDPGPPMADHTPNHVTVIAEFQVSAGDPNVADAGSERRLLVFTQPQSNHNGGQLEFGPDGMLYIGSGDGGSSNDNNVGHTGGGSSRPTNGLGNSQDLTNYLGKILRIDPLDPDGAGPLTYGIPSDNPFFDNPAPGLKKEIYAYGLRNPWRFSFDSRPGGTGRIFCGDVGQGRIEEINLIVAGGNYGWRYLEGDERPSFSADMPNPGGPFIAPIAVYAHPGVVTDPPLPQLGLSVTGGYVYRGAAIPALRGKYVFGDYGSTSVTLSWDSPLMGLEETSPGSGVFTLTQALPLLGGNPIVGQRILTLGEDESGEIYLGMKTNAGVLQLDNGQRAGGIYQIVAEQRVTTVLTPAKDNTIFSEDTDPVRTATRGYDHASDARGYIYAGRTGPNYGPYFRRGLIAFDVPGRIASGSLVQSASLRLNLTKIGPAAAGTSMELRRLTETWGEGTSRNNSDAGFGAQATTDDATWLYRFFSTSLWSTAGGSFSGASSAAATVGNPGPMTWASTPQLVADVQEWVNTPANNAGWILIGDESTNTTACQFESKEIGTRPQLTVTFDTASPPIVLVVPADITAEAAGANGAVVTYSASALDPFGGSYTLIASPASGATFPIGTTAVNLSSNDGNGSTVTASFSVTVQDTTKPVLTLPGPVTAEATGANGATVNFNVSASDAVGVTNLSAMPASGSVFPLGETTVNVTASDAAGNTEMGSFTVTVQDTTKPVLTLPGPVTAEATGANGATVSFNVSASDAVGVTNLSVMPASGSVFPLGETTVNVTAMDAAGNTEMGSFTVTVQDTTAPVVTPPANVTVEATSAAGAIATYGNATASDAVGVVGAVMYSHASGATFPIGMTTVTASAKDAADNTGTATFTVTVQDTTAPTVSGNFPPRVTSETVLADFIGEATASDLVGVTSVTQDPAPGSTLSLGPNTVRVIARDAAGNEGSVSFTVTLHPPNPEHEARFASGGAVPGAGSPGGPPAGATFLSFGVPAINDAGDLAFLAKWRSPSGAGSGIFAGNPPALVVKAGDVVPGPVPGFFKSLTDPALDADGHVAFLATLFGPGVTPSTNTVIVTDAFAGGLQVAAQKGTLTTLPGAPKFKSLRDVSLVDGEVLFTATLVGGTPAVRPTNDAAAFRVTSSGAAPELVAREGDPLGASTVKAFRLLHVVAGSPGQNRGHNPGTASFLALLADGTHALVESTGGVMTEFLATGNVTGGTVLPAATFATFGPIATDLTNAAFAATLDVGGDVTAANASGIFLGSAGAFEPVARTGGAAGDLAGLTFRSFLDPVLAPGAESIAFSARVAGAGVNRSNDFALFYQPAGAALRSIAREGGTQGAPADTKWKSFVSLALPGGDSGPIFHATLSGRGVKPANDSGVWAVDTNGDLVLLFREGDPIDTRTLKRFTILNAVRGSTGVTRAFNDAALVVWRAEFVGGGSAIVVTSVP